MSVTSLLRAPGVRELLEPLLPQEPIRLRLTLRAPPLTERNHGGVGTAFDYAMRFELERRHPHARTTPWIAEQIASPADLLGESADRAVVLELPVLAGTPRTMARRWAQIVVDARAAHERYRMLSAPTSIDHEEIARHALRLARVDVYYRARYVDPEPERADEADVRDVVQLLELAPLEDLGHPALLWLNPDFGLHSLKVGGADVDVISGDRLLDFKATKNPSPKQELLQLLCYLILAHAERRRTPAFPEIREIGIYYARHRHLWLLPAERFVGNPIFETVSHDYFDAADRVFSWRRRLASLAPVASAPSREGTAKPPANRLTKTVRRRTKSVETRRPRQRRRAARLSEKKRARSKKQGTPARRRKRATRRRKGT